MFGTKNQFLYKTFKFGGWPVRSDINFFEAKCFKMMTQDPNDEIIDKFSALNTHVAKVACTENIGEKRHSHLKLLKSYNALRVLTMIDTMLFVELKD